MALSVQLRDAIEKALLVPCPEHRIPDCSPLLNGCPWPSTMKEQADAVMAELGLSAVDFVVEAVEEGSDPGEEMSFMRMFWEANTDSVPRERAQLLLEVKRASQREVGDVVRIIVTR